MTIEWWLLIIIGIVGLIVQGRLQSVFSKYSKVPMTGGLTGREVAEKMLRDNGIHDVTVTSTRGHLTDNYNPTNKTINLSESVYASNSIAAAAVAAHETGHAIQDAYGYAPLRVRSALVPVISFASQWSFLLIIVGIILINTMPAILGRHRPDSPLGNLLGHYAAGGVQCLQPGHAVAGSERHAPRRSAPTGRNRPPMGRTHLPRRSPERHRHPPLLHRVRAKRLTPTPTIKQMQGDGNPSPCICFAAQTMTAFPSSEPASPTPPRNLPHFPNNLKRPYRSEHICSERYGLFKSNPTRTRHRKPVRKNLPAQPVASDTDNNATTCDLSSAAITDLCG